MHESRRILVVIYCFLGWFCLFYLRSRLTSVCWWVCGGWLCVCVRFILTVFFRIATACHAVDGLLLPRSLPSHEHICRELTVLVPVGMLPSHMRAGLPAPKQSGSQGLPEAGFRCPRW